MEKRYQVFVSSTYTDLIEERAEVMQALLELDCIPSGMELFPAASDEQWNWIKRVIDESDYYLVIVGGRYGSISEKTELSFTEMEYHYAVEIDKPVIGFLHENPGKIPADKTEDSPENRKKLEHFKSVVQTKLCKYWETRKRCMNHTFLSLAGCCIVGFQQIFIHVLWHQSFKFVFRHGFR